jgi:hypothetical protein
MAFALHGHKDGAQNRFNKYVLRVETVLVGWGGDQVSFYTTVGDIEDYFWGLGIVGLKLNL